MRCVQDTAAAPAGGALLTLPSCNLARLPPVWWYRYMHAFLVAVADAGNAGCLSTKYAAESIEWLDHSQADPLVSGAWMWTYIVFQAQYYGTVYLSISTCSLSIYMYVHAVYLSIYLRAVYLYVCMLSSGRSVTARNCIAALPAVASTESGTRGTRSCTCRRQTNTAHSRRRADSCAYTSRRRTCAVFTCAQTNHESQATGSSPRARSAESAGALRTLHSTGMQQRLTTRPRQPGSMQPPSLKRTPLRFRSPWGCARRCWARALSTRRRRPQHARRWHWSLKQASSERTSREPIW